MKIKEHITYWRENYVFLPYILLLFIGFTYGVHWWTGRPITDDMDALVGMMLKVVQSTLVVILTGFTKPLLFVDYSPTDKTPFSKHLLDSCETVFLLLFFACLVFSFFR